MEEKINKEEVELTYEQLQQIATALQQRCIKAEAQLNGINYTAFRLDYLFKVIDNDSVFSKTFVEKCCKEIEELLYPSEEAKSEN